MKYCVKGLTIVESQDCGYDDPNKAMLNLFREIAMAMFVAYSENNIDRYIELVNKANDILEDINKYRD